MKFAMTVTVKAMDTHRWIWRIQLFQFNGTSPEYEPEDRTHHRDSRLSSRLRRPIGSLNAELLGIFPRVVQDSCENQGPTLAGLPYPRPAGGTRCVLLASDHLLLLVFLIACQLRELNEVAAGVVQHRNSRSGHVGGRHRELGAAGF